MLDGSKPDQYADNMKFGGLYGRVYYWTKVLRVLRLGIIVS